MLDEYINKNKARTDESSEVNEDQPNPVDEFYASVVEAVSEGGSGLTASMTAKLITQKFSSPSILTKGYLLDV